VIACRIDRKSDTPSGRTVNVRCGYADKTSVDINLEEKIQKCTYKIDAKKKIAVFCQ
jgi:hypothetical protein